MAEILSQWQSCDGWKVRASIGGHTHILTLPSLPSESELAELFTTIELRQQEEQAAKEAESEVLEIIE